MSGEEERFGIDKSIPNPVDHTCYKYIKPQNKILKILILGGGPIGLFIGYKSLKKGNEVTIFEKRKKYTRHNILSLQETSRLDTLSLIPSEIMEELNSQSSYAHINADIYLKKCQKNLLKDKPYLMVNSRVYYIVLNEIECAYEKNFNRCGGRLLKPSAVESYTDIRVEGGCLKYTEDTNDHSIDMSKFDIIFINDGANSLYRNIYFGKTSYTDNIESNIIRYGLNEEKDAIKVSDNLKDIEPLSYGLIFIYNIENKEEFSEKFRTVDKLQKRVDFDSVLKLENENSNFMKGLNVKEILIETNNKNGSSQKLASQNLFRMFVCENYLYISIMVNPRDVGDFAEKLKGQNLPFDELPVNIQIYIKFALYFYDLSELIDPSRLSKNITIKMFPLTFSCVKQSCTFIRKNGIAHPPLQRQDSRMGLTADKLLNQLDADAPVNHYQFVVLSGDAMSSGNFHAGIVLNKNLVAVNAICQMIDEYIDAYPKDSNGYLNNDFLRLLFFHGNLLNQSARNEIITKSINNLINFSALDKDNTVFDLPSIMIEMKDIILCKNCDEKNKLMCTNSAAFVKFMVDNSQNEVLQRILKYLLLPEKYKYKEFLEGITKITPKFKFEQ